jgi:hypothetical protein
VQADDGIKEGCDRFAAGGIDFDERGLAAETLYFRNAPVAALGAAAGDDHRRAGLGQPVTEFAAEHARAADDHGDVAVETEEFLEVRGHDCR